MPPSVRLTRFGQYEFDLEYGELRKSGRKLRIPAQAIQVLGMLVERPGELVTREQLNARLWPNGTIVEFDHSINSCIRRLRAALNDSAEQPRYIETLPKRGYRFIFPCDAPRDLDQAATPDDVALARQYRIISKLGAGSMGAVYQARDTRLGRDAALKFPSESVLENRPLLQAFEREARAAAALNHPNICTVYGVGQQDGRPFIAMELLEGETLESIINSRELSIEEVVAIATQIAAALDAAHTKGIVHRDIKPSNIFVLSGNIVKVMDFGVARLPSEEANTRAGTLQYMAPEQLQGGTADARSDIFSLGVVLYETITRRKPLESQELRVRSLPPQPISALRESVPAKLVQIVNRCLEKDPAARFQAARDVFSRLKEVPGASGPTERLGRIRKWAWRAVAAVACAGLLGGYTFYLRNVNRQSIDSIAVLPFTNATRAADTEYISDGITEALINNLSAAPRLKVIARTTVFRFKDQDIDLRKIGRQLGVETVLTGKVAIRGESVMIQTDLVNVADGSQIWGQHFQRNIADLQGLQGDIAREIAGNLRLKLQGEEQKRLTKRYTENSEAYQLYLKAIYSPRGRPEVWINTHPNRIDLLQQAIEIDPGFARAHAALAACYGSLGLTQTWPAKRAFQNQKDVAKVALKLDDGLGEAHVQLAYALWYLDWDWNGAEREFQRAIDLNTNAARGPYSEFLAQRGRTREALIEVQRAIEVDPLSYRTLHHASWTYFVARMNDAALEMGREARTMGGGFGIAIGFTLAQMGRYDEAIAELEQIRGPGPGVRGHMADAYLRVGRVAEGQAILRELQAGARKDGIGAYEAGFLHATLGNNDEAFKWLDIAFQHRDPGMRFLKTDSLLDTLRSDPRFHELERRVGLAQ